MNTLQVWLCEEDGACNGTGGSAQAVSAWSSAKHDPQMPACSPAPPSPANRACAQQDAMVVHAAPGDRIKGSMWLLRVAAMYKKVLLIVWKSPAEITEFLVGLRKGGITRGWVKGGGKVGGDGFTESLVG